MFSTARHPKNLKILIAYTEITNSKKKAWSGDLIPLNSAMTRHFQIRFPWLGNYVHIVQIHKCANRGSGQAGRNEKKCHVIHDGKNLHSLNSAWTDFLDRLNPLTCTIVHKVHTCRVTLTCNQSFKLYRNSELGSTWGSAHGFFRSNIKNS
jgi:hypothetical protein